MLPTNKGQTHGVVNKVVCFKGNPPISIVIVEGLLS